MKMNFKGLVNLHTLPITMPLLPLYEAIVNSIQSIEDADIKDGKIEVIIERDKQMSIFEDWETDIESIIIRDNGIGFTEENFNSFDTYASEYKIQKGCKGVGRILWLKAYSDVEVDSIYKENEVLMQRTFHFDLKNEVSDRNIKKIDTDTKIETTVKLCNLKSAYKKTCPKKIETIGRDILNHCFAYYVLGKAPKIIITDNHNTIDLDSLYKENMDGNITVVKTNINEVDLTIIHSKNYMLSGNKHEVNLCAHQRVVQPTNLIKLFGNMSAKLEDE